MDLNDRKQRDKEARHRRVTDPLTLQEDKKHENHTTAIVVRRSIETLIIEKQNHHNHRQYRKKDVNRRSTVKDNEGVIYTDHMPTYRFYCQESIDLSLTSSHDKVFLAQAKEHDYHQHWIIVPKGSSNVKNGGAFALVNKATGKALLHSIGETQRVRLIHYDPHNQLDNSILWSMGHIRSGGYRSFKAYDNEYLNMTGKHDGGQIVMDKRANGRNQLWTVMPY